MTWLFGVRYLVEARKGQFTQRAQSRRPCLPEPAAGKCQLYRHCERLLPEGGIAAICVVVEV